MGPLTFDPGPLGTSASLPPSFLLSEDPWGQHTCSECFPAVFSLFPLIPELCEGTKLEVVSPVLLPLKQAHSPLLNCYCLSNKTRMGNRDWQKEPTVEMVGNYFKVMAALGLTLAGIHSVFVPLTTSPSWCCLEAVTPTPFPKALPPRCTPQPLGNSLGLDKYLQNRGDWWVCLLWNLGASQGERLSLQVGRPKGLPVPHRVEKAAGQSLLPVLSQVQPFMFFLRKSSSLSSRRTRLPCQQAQGYRSPGLSQGGGSPLRLLGKGCVLSGWPVWLCT